MTTMQTTDSRPTPDQADVLDVLEEHHAAIAAGDADRVFALFAPDAVVFNLAPPLIAGTGSRDTDIEGMRQWLGTFTAPPRLAHRDPVVHVDGDLAVVHSLTSMTAEAEQGGEFTLWFRSTHTLRRSAGRWLIVHQHESVPFHMDGSFLAATGLEP